MERQDDWHRGSLSVVPLTQRGAGRRGLGSAVKSPEGALGAGFYEVIYRARGALGSAGVRLINGVRNNRCVCGEATTHPFTSTKFNDGAFLRADSRGIDARKNDERCFIPAMLTRRRQKLHDAAKYFRCACSLAGYSASPSSDVGHQHHADWRITRSFN